MWKPNVVQYFKNHHTIYENKQYVFFRRVFLFELVSMRMISNITNLPIHIFGNQIGDSE